MTKVHPNGNNDTAMDPTVVLTVWHKSLLFNCDGFTVFDAHGNLVYRVDNYMSASKAEISLMDALGKSLLTIRRKRLSLGDSWLVFDGEMADSPMYLVKKNVNPLSTKCLARIVCCSSSKRINNCDHHRNPDVKVVYEIEGSYARRCCAVYDDRRRLVAEVRQKEASVKGVAFGTDIFHLVLYPALIDMPLAMAIVILLDQMFGSSIARRPRLITT